MVGKARYILTVCMDVEADKEALFNEVYDTEHVPLISEVAGVLAVKRYRNVPLAMIIGGEAKTIIMDGEPQYMAVYELESPEVLTGEGWAKAVDAGRWAREVRPYTKNRRHVLRKLIE